ELANESVFTIVTVTIALSPTPRLTESRYVVQEGDTLSGIADMFHVTWDAIIQANNLESQDNIFVGQELVIPLAATPEAE
ncbi:MAG: LysM peptidoglycan-binding domain-containing protein, partial [Thermomicrobiales bacterium]|nr:LysM peptidoglycan-binding domain-containing protein [Thermomicrobiales bacterium]